MVLNRQARACDGCTICCGGWLTLEAHGEAVYPGRPCSFRGCTGCTIYKDRPDVCRTYRCAWLDSFEFPEWLKPDQAKVLINWDKCDGIDFLDVIEAGQRIDSRVLSWLVMYALKNKINLRYEVDKGKNKIGAPDFIACQSI